MNKKTRDKLLKTQEIVTKLLAGERFSVSNGEIDCVPRYIGATTKTAQAKNNKVLKRGAKPIGQWDFALSSCPGRGYGEIYASSSFKAKPK